MSERMFWLFKNKIQQDNLKALKDYSQVFVLVMIIKFKSFIAFDIILWISGMSSKWKLNINW